jgi:AAA+ superfamily predicted ATPase
LEYIKDFLEQTDVTKLKCFEHINCSNEEFHLLQYFFKGYLKGKDSIVCYLAILHFFDKDSVDEEEIVFDFENKIELLSKVEIFKSLVKQGFLVANISVTEFLELTDVEILNLSFSLSRMFLVILQDGTSDIYIQNSNPYKDEVEYINDQFKRLDFYQAVSSFSNIYDTSYKAVSLLLKNIELIEEDIKTRLEKSKIKIKLEYFFTEHELCEKSQIIFLALLKNEYFPNDTFMTFYSLIDLVSFNDEDKLKNRVLLSSDSQLIKDNLIYPSDEIFLNDLSGYMIDRDVLDSLDIISDLKTKRKSKAKAKIQDIIEEQDIFEYIEPKTSLDDVVLNPDTYKTLANLLKQVNQKVLSRLKKWGIKDKKSGISSKIIFYGVAGTGKTMTAHSLAKSLKRGILSFDCSKVLSMYIGESEKNVRKIFDDFKEISKQFPKEPILLLNEADQFLSTRTTTSGSGSEKMHNQMQNIFLEQIEKFDGILIATTNLLETIDKAFSRRFNYKIEFKKPTLSQRVSLWEKLLPHNAPFEDINIASLAKHELTGGQIKIIVENTAFKVACKDEPLFTMKDFTEEIEKEKKSSFDTTRQMGFEL